jgi:hypothetical protein
MASAWSYADAGNSITGDMQCPTCGKAIDSGEYRYRQKSKGGDWWYVAQHRACTMNDPQWGVLDAQREAALDRRKALSRACRQFQAEWGIADLNDYIFDDDSTGERNG